MFRARQLALLALVVSLAVVAFLYIQGRSAEAGIRPVIPDKLPDHIAAQADQGWSYRHSDGHRPIYEVRAASFQQIKEPSTFQLKQVELKLFKKDGQGYDRVESADATFDIAEGVMTSPGAVKIVMGVQDNQAPQDRERLMSIESSGVRLESKSGKVSTDQPTQFAFDRGNGKATGATYDPNNGELRLLKDAELHWTAGAKPMTVQAGEITYKEKESKVFLGPWSKLQRQTLAMEAGPAVVTLDKGAIRLLEADTAKGVDQLPKQTVEYAAEKLRVEFDEKGEVQAVQGDNNARLVSQTASGKTTVTTQKLELSFVPSPAGNQLTKALAHGNAVIESTPAAPAGKPAPETRILRSDVVEMAMRAGGEEIERVLTHSPGTVEFLPNAPTQRKRTLTGERLTIDYGKDNVIETFRAVQATTKTEQQPSKGKPAPPPALTWSKDLLARFDAKGDVTKLEQWNEFRYQEGTRQAKADRAELEQAKQLITLTGQARYWDETGSTSADRILINQTNNDVDAAGKVVSLRQPETKPTKPGQATPLAKDQPLQARAARMMVRDQQQTIHYEGEAFLWQGANRLQADKVDIDRKANVLVADGKVVSQFVDQPQPGKTAGQTVVKAPWMRYEDQQKQALYKGGVLLERPGLAVRSHELRAFLKDDGKGNSTLDKAFADGKVNIDQSQAERTRQGTSEHAEYYVADERIVLERGEPKLVDSVKGTTRGARLTLLPGQDRLLVEGGTEEKPAVSRIKKGK